MRSRFRFLLLPTLAVIGASVLLQPASAQYGQVSSTTLRLSEWENNRFRLRRIAVDPGASARAEGGVDRVLIYLTANQDGNMPDADAVWQPAGSPDLQNRGARKLEALAVDLKAASAAAIRRNAAGSLAHVVSCRSQDAHRQRSRPRDQAPVCSDDVRRSTALPLG